MQSSQDAFLKLQIYYLVINLRSSFINFKVMMKLLLLPFLFSKPLIDES